MLEKLLMICVNRRMAPADMSCALQGSLELAERLEHKIVEEKLDITVQRMFCLGRCDHGPVLKLAPSGEFLLGMNEEEIIERVRSFASKNFDNSEVHGKRRTPVGI